MRKRKHRVVVEMTTSRMVTEEQAMRALERVLRLGINWRRDPIWPSGDIYCHRLVAKQFSKVYVAERAKEAT